MNFSDKAQDAEAIAKQFEEASEWYAKGNMFEFQKYLSPTVIVIAPESATAKGSDATANAARDIHHEYRVTENPIKNGPLDFIVQKPDMAVFTFRTISRNQSGEVLNNHRSLHVWRKNKNTWKQQVVIFNHLPRDYFPF